MCTSAAPASSSIATIWRVVLPRTIESSTTTRRWPRDHGRERVELQPDALLAHRLLGLDEAAPHVAVAHHRLGVGDARLAGVADGRGRAAVGQADHEVGLGRALAGQLGAHGPPPLPHGRAVHLAVGAGEVDVLEHAQPAALRRDRLAALDPLGRQPHGLARAHVALEGRADLVEGAGLRRDAPAVVVEAADHERPHAVGRRGRPRARGRSSRRPSTRRPAAASPRRRPTAGCPARRRAARR